MFLLYDEIYNDVIIVYNTKMIVRIVLRNFRNYGGTSWIGFAPQVVVQMFFTDLSKRLKQLRVTVLLHLDEVSLSYSCSILLLPWPKRNIF